VGCRHNPMTRELRSALATISHARQADFPTTVTQGFLAPPHSPVAGTPPVVLPAEVQGSRFDSRRAHCAVGHIGERLKDFQATVRSARGWSCRLVSLLAVPR
jgi:hypothetical protein